MANPKPADPQTPASSEDTGHEKETAFTQAAHNIRTRLLEGLFVLLPILVTFWIIRWLYSSLEKYVIDPLAVFVLWKARALQSQPELPYWFETYVAPVIAIILALVILYICGAMAHSSFRKRFDSLMLRLPIVSHIYDAVQSVLKSIDKPKGQSGPQRVVLVPFPQPGMRVPGIVTGSCKDVSTGKTLLCVYISTTPMPTSGFFVLIPEEDATELNWDVQQTFQAIFSGGLTVPPDVTYFRSNLASPLAPDAATLVSQLPLHGGDRKG
jgi:uncharacterized membrane protein